MTAVAETAGSDGGVVAAPVRYEWPVIDTENSAAKLQDEVSVESGRFWYGQPVEWDESPLPPEVGYGMLPARRASRFMREVQYDVSMDEALDIVDAVTNLADSPYEGYAELFEIPLAWARDHGVADFTESLLRLCGVDSRDRPLRDDPEDPYGTRVSQAMVGAMPLFLIERAKFDESGATVLRTIELVKQHEPTVANHLVNQLTLAEMERIRGQLLLADASPEEQNFVLERARSRLDVQRDQDVKELLQRSRAGSKEKPWHLASRRIGALIWKITTPPKWFP